jgi:outer membrane protein assembly factor BamB
MVIDLGDVPFEAETSGRQWRWFAHLAAQPVVLVAVVLALFALGGSARPLPALRPVMTADGSSGVLALSSTLFTAGSDPSTGNLTWIRRYSLSDRSMTWTARLPQPVEQLDFAASANVLVAAALSTLDNGQISVLDADTGTVLWRLASGVAVLRLAGTSALLSTADTDQAVLKRVDLRTGATLWSRSFDPTGYLDAGDPAFGAPTRIVTVNNLGRAAVYDFTDGKVLATADLGAEPRQNDDGRTDTAQFTALGDRLYLVRRDSGAESLTAYRLADLQRLWRSTSVPVGRPSWCGSVLCVTTAEGMTVLDGADGSVRWSGKRWLLGFDTRAVGIPGPSRLIVIDSLRDPQRALLDPASGRVLSLLGQSIFVGGTLLRSDVQKVGRTWVQVPGPGNSFRTVGRLETVAPARCVAVAGYLACQTSTGSTTVWQIPD